MARTSQRMTAGEMAIALNKAKSTVSLWERGLVFPMEDTVSLISVVTKQHESLFSNRREKTQGFHITPDAKTPELRLKTILKMARISQGIRLMDYPQRLQISHSLARKWESENEPSAIPDAVEIRRIATVLGQDVELFWS